MNAINISKQCYMFCTLLNLLLIINKWNYFLKAIFDILFRDWLFQIGHLSIQSYQNKNRRHVPTLSMGDSIYIPMGGSQSKAQTLLRHTLYRCPGWKWLDCASLRTATRTKLIPDKNVYTFKVWSSGNVWLFLSASLIFMSHFPSLLFFGCYFLPLPKSDKAYPN